MFPLGSTPRFLTRLAVPPDRDERGRIERVLAFARVFLASSGMWAIYLDPTEPSRYSTLAYVLLTAYVLYSAAVWVIVHRSEAMALSFPWMHAVDMAFPTIFTLFTEGPNSPFFLFFVFVMTAAALRWGFVETVLTSIAVSVLMTMEAVLLSHSKHFGAWLEGEYETNRFVIRLFYLLILGVLLGYLAEEEKQLRAESTFIARLIGQARVDTGLRNTVQAVFNSTMRLFLAPRALAILQQNNSSRVFLWQSQAQPRGDNSVSAAEVDPEERAHYTAPLPNHSFFAQRLGSIWRTRSIGLDGRKCRPDPGWTPAGCPRIGPARSLLGVRFALGEEWTGWLLLFDARTGADRFKELGFAQKLLAQVGPAVYNVYLMRRLRSRVSAVERARVARELHDGAIQALIAIEMEVYILRREASRPMDSDSLASRLMRIQELLREQVFDLRTLMQQMRPLDINPSQLLEYLTDMVERFRRDTGIAAEFVCGLDEVELSPRICRELVRILQEALTNIRKHSGAHRVLVRLGIPEGNWSLSVEDDGRGFPFVGKKCLAELDAAHQGPVVIKERVRALGGNLEIESLPGQGTRLEVTFPQRAQAAYV